MKKISLFLAFLMLLQCIFLVACNKKEQEETTPEITTPETTTPADPPVEPDNNPKILAGDISKYNLICAARTAGSTMTQYWLLQSQIKAMCGKEPLAETDRTEVTEFEILVGTTNREETQVFLSNLLWNDYGYAIVGNKIVIAGHTAEGTTAAMKLFLEHLKSGDHTEVFFTNKNQYLYRYPYQSDTFLLNGIDVSRAKIIVNEDVSIFQRIAQTLSDRSLELCGRRPEIITDEALAQEDDLLIILGSSTHVPADMQAEWDAKQTNEEERRSYYVNCTENVVWITTAVLEGYRAINRNVLPQIEKSGVVSVSLEKGLFKQPQLFSVMSFNVFVGNHDSARVTRVINTILDNSPSVFGVQEADVLWMTSLKSGLEGVYTSVGVGRDWGGLGEHTAIFYRTDMFNCIKSGTKWLSSTPDTMGSKLTNANFPRIMTYAILERKNDGAKFLYVNTHLDHNGNNSHEIAEGVRQQQIEILIAEIKKLGDLPTIVTGDFNVTPEASAYKTMIANGFLDTSRVAKEGEIKSTYNGMKEPQDNVIIDYIFVSPELANVVEEYVVCSAKRDGAFISDHNAIIATITLPLTKTE